MYFKVKPPPNCSSWLSKLYCSAVQYSYYLADLVYCNHLYFHATNDRQTVSFNRINRIHVKYHCRKRGHPWRSKLKSHHDINDIRSSSVVVVITVFDFYSHSTPWKIIFYLLFVDHERNPFTTLPYFYHVVSTR